MLEILSVVFEVLLGAGGVYALYQSQKHLRSIGDSSSVAQVWSAFTYLALWGAGSGALLASSVVFGGRSVNVLIISLFTSLVLVGAGLVVAIIKHRRLTGPAPVAVNTTDRRVVIKHLVAGRTRWIGTDGASQQFSTDELKALDGSTGYVRILNWASAVQLAGTDARKPLMGFWNEAGDTFLLYSDDELAEAV